MNVPIRISGVFFVNRSHTNTQWPLTASQGKTGCTACVCVCVYLVFNDWLGNNCQGTFPTWRKQTGAKCTFRGVFSLNAAGSVWGSL